MKRGILFIGAVLILFMIVMVGCKANENGKTTTSTRNVTTTAAASTKYENLSEALSDMLTGNTSNTSATAGTGTTKAGTTASLTTSAGTTK